MNSTIRTNMDSVRNYNVFSQNQTAASQAMTRATTGLRVASVQDGPADWAVSQKMQERINSLNQASRNIQNDNALSKTASDGIANTIDILKTLKERVIHAGDTSTNTDDRNVIFQEINELYSQIDENANNVKYNGKALLNGTISKAAASAQSATTSSTFSFRVGDESGMTIDLKIMSMTATKLGFASGAAEFKASALGTATGTTTAITKIDAALTKALEAATTIGSVQERLGYTADNVATQIENLEASNSTVVESDVAKEITDYMKWSVLSQASQYMLAQSNQNAFSVLNLLQ